MNRLVCNSCYSPVDGIGYRTKCFHFYCPTCAKSAFQSSTQCPICTTSLSDEDVAEVTVGIPSTKSALQGYLYQHVLESTAWEDVQNSLNRLLMGVMDCQHFVTSQMLLEVSHAGLRGERAELEVRRQEAHVADLNEKLLEQEARAENMQIQFQELLGEKSRHLAELQDAYKEKQRKCLAWEKAYVNIRNQLAPGREEPESVLMQTTEADGIPEHLRGALQRAGDTVSMSQARRRTPHIVRTEVSSFRKSSSHGRLFGNPAAAYAPDESPRRLSQFEEDPYHLYGGARGRDNAQVPRLGQVGHFLAHQPTPTTPRPLSKSYASWQGKGPDMGRGENMGGRGMEMPSFFDGP